METRERKRLLLHILLAVVRAEAQPRAADKALHDIASFRR